MMKSLIRTYLLPIFIFALGSSMLNGRTFPSHIGDFALIGVRTYESQELGFSIRYEAPEDKGKIDIYYYDLGLDKIETGVGDSVSTQLANTTANLYTMEEMGHYKNVEEIKSGSATFKEKSEQPLPFIWALHKYTQTSDNYEYTSFSLLTGYQNRFLKIRFSLTGEITPEEASSRFVTFLNEFETVFF